MHRLQEMHVGRAASGSSRSFEDRSAGGPPSPIRRSPYVLPSGLRLSSEGFESLPTGSFEGALQLLTPIWREHLSPSPERAAVHTIPMNASFIATALCAAAAVLTCGCVAPSRRSSGASAPSAGQLTDARPKLEREAGDAALPKLPDAPGPDDYVRFALRESPRVRAAYELWRAAAERAPQVGALPDTRLNLGYFLEEVETRVGPQRARVGIQQSFPWPGTLQGREDAASRAASAEWHRFQAVRLEVAEQVLGAFYELAYLDASLRVTRSNFELLASFEEIVRARYRVGASSHPELVRVQVALGQLEDRLRRLEALRPAQVADLNAALDRNPEAVVQSIEAMPERHVDQEVDALVELAFESNPLLSALEEQAEEQRRLADVARDAGRPEFMLGLEYIFTDEAVNPSMADSGKDPVILTFGMSLPFWRAKYAAGVREAQARRRAISLQRENEANRISASIHRAHFEHTDAHRRVALYEESLIPKAEESLRASLTGFQGGETTFLELLDAERTLLEFALITERSRADRGKSLARLEALVGTRLVDSPSAPSDPPKEPQR